MEKVKSSALVSCRYCLAMGWIAHADATSKDRDNAKHFNKEYLVILVPPFTVLQEIGFWCSPRTPYGHLECGGTLMLLGIGIWVNGVLTVV
jgi:hypothetical protein